MVTSMSGKLRAPPPRRTRKKQNQSARTDECARAVGAFRQGSVVRIENGDGSNLMALAVETASQDAAEAFARKLKDRPFLILTHARARTLKIRLYTPGVVAIRPALPLRVSSLRAIADPTVDLAEPLKGPFDTVREELNPACLAAVKLAKLGGLLPAALVGQGTRNGLARLSVSSGSILAYEDDAARDLALVTRARVPLERAENTELVAFRSSDGGPEYYAIVIGAPAADRPVLARLHSECFTGDLLGSLRCDCGAQLRGAIAAIAEAGGGVLLYLAQEGRGIGLINKLRAYRLQDQGFDTMEANERLGFEADERLYGIAARMLHMLGYKFVRLLTNNPEKVKALEAEGIAVSERVPHKFPENVHNSDYLRTKARKAGHLF